MNPPPDTSPLAKDDQMMRQFRMVLSALIVPVVVFFLTRHIAVSHLGFEQTRGDILAALVAVVVIHVVLIGYAIRVFREGENKKD